MEELEVPKPRFDPNFDWPYWDLYKKEEVGEKGWAILQKQKKEYEQKQADELVELRKPEPKEDKPFEEMGVAHLSKQKRTPQEKKNWEEWKVSKHYKELIGGFD